MTNWFEQFVRERRYLKNVTPKTERYYRNSWSSFVRLTGSEQITKAKLVEWVIKLRESGVKPVSCNTYISGVNAFCAWLHEEDHLPERLKVKKLKVEQKILKTVEESALMAIASFKPSDFVERRIHVLLCLLIDTGIRIDEALTLNTAKVDMENLLLTVFGKGQKERIIPFSYQLRKILVKYLRNHKFPLVFCTRDGNKLSYYNVTRDYKDVCKKLKIEKEGNFHRLRHTFALNYVRSGGGLFHLQKQLGHTTLTQTRKYTELETKDLTAAHSSPLSRMR
ncbi:MAG: tyrosine-type recombinase/integrase [Pyrinomonadaceae bacterium MAG19_C2-C3]|nr:tyrosine-type recombinase/integrase [Pyrinomonadaceae bacterium MAG19_C2-C3]